MVSLSTRREEGWCSADAAAGLKLRCQWEQSSAESWRRVECSDGATLAVASAVNGDEQWVVRILGGHRL